ncbi:MAG: DoxX family protein [Chitinophagaceae bacterium]
MKKTKILYWVITIIFAGFMIFTAIPNVMVDADSVNLVTTYLGYPKYFIPYIGIAKILGSIVILVPGLNRLKEWAYAGLFFDLAGATYSIIYTSGVSPDITFMILPIVFLFLSYFLWHKVSAVK